MRKIALALAFSLALLPAYRAKACGGGNYSDHTNHSGNYSMQHSGNSMPMNCEPMMGMEHDDNNYKGDAVQDGNINYKSETKTEETSQPVQPSQQTQQQSGHQH